MARVSPLTSDRDPLYQAAQTPSWRARQRQATAPHLEPRGSSDHPLKWYSKNRWAKRIACPNSAHQRHRKPSVHKRTRTPNQVLEHGAPSVALAPATMAKSQASSSQQGPRRVLRTVGAGQPSSRKQPILTTAGSQEPNRSLSKLDTTIKRNGDLREAPSQKTLLTTHEQREKHGRHQRSHTLTATILHKETKTEGARQLNATEKATSVTWEGGRGEGADHPDGVLLNGSDVPLYFKT